MVGARYGRLPTEIWATLPMRLIARYFLLVQREQERQRIFQARLAGAEDLEEPDWLEDAPPQEPEKSDPVPEGYFRAVVPGRGPVLMKVGSAEYHTFFGG